ncbi:PREDICTED: redox-regulatory protein FAM213A [Dipodomys ordii]|uniref:Peroxiredoxin-like 2A n=1 Tax=Dipodomys ordii TaxID=10020 RepID=A0A1S3GH19_DIPOR|nr:PREDICTED: redox-regulatory protein FAM213A [Dipodomys ordii]
MSFLQDPSFFTMGMWSIGAGALGAATLAVLLANTDLFLSKPKKATLEYLEEIDLKTLEKEPRTFKAKELWQKRGAVIMAVRRPGCFLCRETHVASRVCSTAHTAWSIVKLQHVAPRKVKLLRTHLSACPPLGGMPGSVTKLELISWVSFRLASRWEAIIVSVKKFYGPQKRKMLFMGFIRLGVWTNFFRAWNGGFSGNLEGEGVILGGVFVMGSGKQGILLEHREKEFGDKVDLRSVLEAAAKIKQETLASEQK